MIELSGVAILVGIIWFSIWKHKQRPGRHTGKRPQESQQR